MAIGCNHKWEIRKETEDGFFCIDCGEKLSSEEIKKILQTNGWILKRDEI